MKYKFDSKGMVVKNTPTPKPTATTKPTATPTPEPQTEYKTVTVKWQASDFDNNEYHGTISGVGVHKDPGGSWEWDNYNALKADVKAAIDKTIPGGFDECAGYSISKSTTTFTPEPQTEYKTVTVNWHTNDFDGNSYEGTISGVGVHRNPGGDWKYDNKNDVKNRVEAAIDKTIPGGFNECSSYSFNF